MCFPTSTCGPIFFSKGNRLPRRETLWRGRLLNRRQRVGRKQPTLSLRGNRLPFDKKSARKFEFQSTLRFIILCFMCSFFTLDKPGYQLAQLPQNPRPTPFLQLGAVYLGGSHAPFGSLESDRPLRLPGHSQWPIKDHRGTSVSGYLPLDKPMCRLLGFENKFSTPFVFEAGTRIEPPRDREQRGLILITPSVWLSLNAV